MRRPRGLSREEAELWGRVAKTVRPLAGKVKLTGPTPSPSPEGEGDFSVRAMPKPLPFRGGVGVGPVEKPKSVHQPRPLDRHGLDGSWEKKLARAEVQPDFTLDLHGHSLDAAHARLDHGLAQAVTMGARVVLVITGKPRPVDAADRGSKRGAIRAKLLDWLALGSHASKIAAVRAAHRKHGGAGAVYVVLKRPK
jgi:DNA-nicking Smr family endonuclease